MDHILRCHEIVKTDFIWGKNCYLYDAGENQYIDFESGIWSTALGHNHPRINQTIKDQTEKVIHLGTRYPSMIADEAAIDVLDIVGIGKGKCTFLSSGSEAVEFAVNAVRRITSRQQLITFTNSYLAAYGSAGRKSSDEWVLLDWNEFDPEDIDAFLKDVSFDTIGGFIFEPGGSSSGFVKFPPKRLVQEIAQRVKRAGGLLAVNEITTGMGRTGKWFGFQHYGLHPDIVALGKGLGNGYPISAGAMTLNCADKLEESGLHYAQSHQNDPLGCSVAREVIAIMREENLVERGNKIGSYFLDGLRSLQEKHAVIKDARGRGMLLALEFHPHKIISATRTFRLLLDRGLLVGYYPEGNILRFDPSLTIEKDDVSRLLDNLDSILMEAG